MSGFRCVKAVLLTAAFLILADSIEAVETLEQAAEILAQQADGDTLEMTTDLTPVDPKTIVAAHLQEIQKTIEEDAFEKAIKLSTELIEREPNCAEAWALRGRAKNNLDQCEEARPDFEQALRLDPHCVEALHGLACTYFEIQPQRAKKYYNLALARDPKFLRSLLHRCRLYINLKEWDKAHADCEAIEKIPYDKAPFFHCATILHFGRKEYDETLAYAEKMKKLDPSYPYSYSISAMAYARKGEADKALAEYREFKRLETPPNLNESGNTNRQDNSMDMEDWLTWCDIVLLDNPNDAVALLQRAAAYLKLGQLDEAFADATQAKALRADLAGAYAHRGEIFSLRNDVPAALAEVEEGLQAVPDDTFLIQCRANGRMLQGDLEQAQADMEIAVKRDPRYAVNYSAWGDRFASNNQFDEALKIYNRVLELAPQCHQAIEGRGKIHYTRQQWQDALADFQKLAALQPNSIAGYWNQAGVYWEQKQLDELLACLNQVLEIEPEHAPALMARAKAAVDLRRFDDALRDANEYIKLKPHDDEGMRERGFIYCNKGRFDLAMADLTEAIRMNPQNFENHFWRGSLKYQYCVWLTTAAPAAPAQQQGANDSSAGPQQSTLKNPSVSEFSLSNEFGGKVAKTIADANQQVESQKNNSAQSQTKNQSKPNTGIFGQELSAIKDDNQVVQNYLRESLADLDEAVKLEPENSRGLELRAKICTQLHDDEAALVSLDALVRLNPKNAEAYLDRGTVLTRLGRYDDALADFDKVLELDPQNTLVYYSRAGLYMKKGESQKASDEFAKAREMLRLK